MASGVAETVGAVGGAAAGGVIGLATGNTIEGIGAGAGLGDTLGKMSVGAVSGTISGTKNVVKGVHDHNTEKNEIEEKRKVIIEDINEKIKEIDGNTYRAEIQGGTSGKVADAVAKDKAQQSINKAKDAYQNTVYKTTKHTTIAGNIAGKAKDGASKVANKTPVAKNFTKKGKTDRAFKDIGNL